MDDSETEARINKLDGIIQRLTQRYCKKSLPLWSTSKVPFYQGLWTTSALRIKHNEYWEIWVEELWGNEEITFTLSGIIKNNVT